MVRLSLVNLGLIKSFCILLLLPLFASLECLLSALIRLARHGGFIGRKLVALKHNSVYWDHHTILEVHDVSNVQVIDMDINVIGFSFVIWARHSHLFTI